MPLTLEEVDPVAASDDTELQQITGSQLAGDNPERFDSVKSPLVFRRGHQIPKDQIGKPVRIRWWENRTGALCCAAFAFLGVACAGLVVADFVYIYLYQHRDQNEEAGEEPEVWIHSWAFHLSMLAVLGLTLCCLLCFRTHGARGVLSIASIPKDWSWLTRTRNGGMVAAAAISSP